MTTSAITRMTRLTGVFTGVCALAYLVFYAPRIAESFSRSPVWTLATTVGEATGAVVILWCVRARADRALKWASFAWCGYYFVCEAAWRPMWDGSAFAVGDWPWHHSYTAIPVILIAPYVPGWVALLMLIVVIPPVQLVTSGYESDDLWYQILNGWSFGGFTVLVPITLLRVGRRRDEEEREARRRSAAAVAAEAEVVERERVDGLIHDSVMATLLSASRVGTVPEVRAGARRALQELDLLRTDPTGESPVHPDAFLGLLRSSLHFVDPTLEIRVEVHGDVESAAVPGAAARALVAAASEALRNSHRHAGECTRSAAASLRRVPSGLEVRIEVVDDGPGFDLDRVPPERLGIRASIVNRMRVIHGGSAEVVTSAGAGTRVVLVWTAP